MDSKLLPDDIFGTQPKKKEEKKPEKKSVVEKAVSAKKQAKPAVDKKTKKVKIEKVEMLLAAKPTVKKAKPVKPEKPKKADVKIQPEKAAKTPQPKATPKPKLAAKPKKPGKTGKKISMRREELEIDVRAAELLEPDAVEVLNRLGGVQDEQDRTGDFPWEYPDGESPNIPCDACGEPIHPEAKVCIHCGTSFVNCPHCHGKCAALYNPKMATEQRMNRIFKQYTLFSIALPSLPFQPILDCSCCHERMMLCEACRTPMAIDEESCPKCGFRVRKTKLIMSPLSLLEVILKKPDVSRSIQRAVENFLRSMSEW